jgi:hypothetical protein
MASINERFPKKGLFSAKTWEQPGDLVLTIDYFIAGEQVGSSFKDVVHFANDARSLALNDANAHAIAKLHGDDTDGWCGKQVVLYLDPDVEFAGQKTGGIRVRDQVPSPTGNGAQPAKLTAPEMRPGGRDLDDEIPF